MANQCWFIRGLNFWENKNKVSNSELHSDKFLPQNPEKASVIRYITQIYFGSNSFSLSKPLGKKLYALSKKFLTIEKDRLEFDRI